MSSPASWVRVPFQCCLLLLLLMSTAPVSAEHVLASEKDPVHVELKSSIDVEKAKYGDAFEAVVTERHLFNQKELPAGTILQGKVEMARVSRTCAMPGYAQLNVQKAVFPSGQTYTFKSEEEKLKTQKIMNPDAVTIRQIGKSALPFTLISAADAIPLKYAAGMSSWIILPISLGARMTLGAVLEQTKGERKWHEKRHHSASMRYGHGLLRGTGITGVYYFLHPSPNPTLTAGDVVPLHFKEDALSDLFAAGSPVLSETESLEMIERDGQEFTMINGKVVRPQASPQK